MLWWTIPLGVLFGCWLALLLLRFIFLRF